MSLLLAVNQIKMNQTLLSRSVSRSHFRLVLLLIISFSIGNLNGQEDCYIYSSFETGAGVIPSSPQQEGWYSTTGTPSYTSTIACAGDQSIVLKSADATRPPDRIRYQRSGPDGQELLVEKDCGFMVTFCLRNTSPDPGFIDFYANGQLYQLITEPVTNILGWRYYQFTVLSHPDIYSLGFGNNNSSTVNGPINLYFDQFCIRKNCTPAQNVCCDDEDEFNDLVSQGIEIKQDGCEVSLALPQFDSCYFLSHNGPSDWGDSTAVLPATQNLPAGPWNHTYTASGDYVVCFTVYERDSLGGACWSADICDTITVDCCSDLECEMLDIEVVPADFTENDCCLTGTIKNDWCDEGVRCIKLNTSALTMSQIQLRPGWTFASFSPTESLLCYQDGDIPIGTFEVFDLCLSGEQDDILKMCWIGNVESGEETELCCEEIRVRGCGINLGCLDIVKDTVLCEDNRYCMDIQNISEPKFTMTNIAIETVTPGVTLSPLTVPITLAPGDIQNVCFSYDPAQVSPGDTICFMLTGHRYGEEAQCCQDTITHCFVVPGCCTEPTCDLVSVKITADTDQTDICCLKGTLQNTWCDEGLRCIRIRADQAILSQISLMPDWSFTSYTATEAVICYDGGDIPLGEMEVFNACLTSAEGGAIETCVLWDDNGQTKEACCTSERIVGCNPIKCLGVIADTFYCETNQYCIEVQNNSNPEFTITEIIVQGLTPAGTLSPMTFPVSLAHGDKDTLCFSLDTMGIVTGDEICFQLSGHTDQDNATCCIDTISYCFTVPKCCTNEPNCDFLSSSVTPYDTGDEVCCYTVQLSNNDCETLYRGIRLCTEDGSDIGYVQSQTGWIVDYIDASCVEVRLADGGYIARDIHRPLLFCPSQGNTASIKLEWITGSGENTTYVCPEMHDLSCSITDPNPSECFVMKRDSFDCSVGKYCILLQNTTSPSFSISSIILDNQSSITSVDTQRIVLEEELAYGDSTWICVDYQGMMDDSLRYTIYVQGTNDSGEYTYACTDNELYHSLVPECTSASFCCTDQNGFDSLLAIGYEVSVDSGRVVVQVNQFDSCHFTPSRDPDWGDGSLVQATETSIDGPTIWVHQYDQPGTYEVCLDVIQKDNRDSVCYRGKICSTLVITEINVGGGLGDCRAVNSDRQKGLTPNGDGFNDFLKVTAPYDCQSIDIKVFNRWGQMVYEAFDYQNDWGGTGRNNEQLADGTYFIVADFNGVEGTVVKHSRSEYFIDLRTQ